jgi:parallel beta-helix repeat protein
MGLNNLRFELLVITAFFSSLIFCAVLPNCAAEGSGDYPPPGDGDWIIENDTYVANETIIINGEINITANVSLTLNNVTLLINSSQKINGIFVNETATLNLYNSNLTGHLGPFTFDILGNMTMEHSEVSHLIGGTHIHPYSDVLINNSIIYDNYDNAIVCHADSMISNNTIYDSYGGISVESCSPIIFNNTIYDNYGGIFVSFIGYPLIWNNTITHNERGIVSIVFSYPYVYGNVISDNTDDGINLELGHIELHYNSIYSNGGFGIWSDHTSINSSNNLIYDNKFWGLYSFGADIQSENDTFEKDGKINQDGDVLLEWEILVKVFYQDGEEPHEVHLIIYDDYGNIMYDGYTVSNIRTVVLQEYEYLNDGSILNHSPFTIKASKGDYKNSTTVEVKENMLVTIYLDLEPHKDYEFPFWGIMVVSGIWVIVAIMVVLGLAVNIRMRKRTSL